MFADIKAHMPELVDIKYAYSFVIHMGWKE